MSDASPTLFSESLPLTREAAEREAAALRAEIARHDELYYQQHAPVISDYDYDQLVKRLQAIEAEFPDLITPDSPTQRIGGRPSEGFASVPHRIRMLSLDNVYSPDELREWEARCRRACDGPFDYVAELKIDGLSLALRYTDGLLTEAITRGDGLTGDLVTENARTIRQIPLRLAQPLAADIEVRGEVYLPLSAFRRLNADLEAEGEKNLRQSPERCRRHDEAAGLTGGCQSAAGDVLLRVVCRRRQTLCHALGKS